LPHSSRWQERLAPASRAIGRVKRRFFLHKHEKRHPCFYKLLNLNTNITWYEFCFKGV
jgi:hypothetical protein